MSQETEDIEARLAAYIDGELSASEREEIERHLEANPEHRRLIDDLLRQRDMVRGLPHQTAPPDVADILQSKLERSALLSHEPGDESNIILRINRWPHITAVAAILLLAVGLAAVLYMALPQSRPPAFTIAPSKPAVAEEKPPEALARADADGMRDAKDVAKAMKDLSAAEQTPAAATPFLEQRDSEVIGKSAAVAGKAKSQDALFGVDNAAEPVVVVVSTDNPARTRSQVADYFTSNKISWEDVPESMPAPLNLAPSQVAEAARYNATRVRMKTALDSATSAPAAHRASQETQQQAQSFKYYSAGDVGAGAEDRSRAQASPSQAKQTNSGSYLLARGMTLQQANQLTSTLCNSGPSQSAQLYFTQQKTPAPSPSLPAESDFDKRTSRNEDGSAAARESRPDTLWKAAPSSPSAEMKKQAVDEQLHALARGGAEWHARPASTATTQAVQSANGAFVTAALGQIAATAPAVSASTKEALDKLDVVILLQDQSATAGAQPAGAPSTQPNAATPPPSAVPTKD